LPPEDHPRVSILLVLLNRAELTFLCLESILANCRIPYELVLVDNGSQDQTRQLLERMDGARVIRNAENQGFIRAVNQAAEVARGEHLLLLNNDTRLIGDGPAIAAERLDRDPTIGAVGGRLISPDGTLQEAGSEVRPDGSTRFVGRGAPPLAPAFQTERTVDYCSGAFLMTPARDFRALGGLDEDFSPAYFDDLDYCARLAQRGKRVVYEPRIVLLHYESASSSPQYVRQLMRDNREKFLEKHGDWLKRRKAS
jgi:GT2 family glycosyltransferase